MGGMCAIPFKVALDKLYYKKHEKDTGKDKILSKVFVCQDKRRQVIVTHREKEA